MAKINIQHWGEFTLETLFTIVKGSRLTKKDMIDGNINYIGATAFNNGICYQLIINTIRSKR